MRVVAVSGLIALSLLIAGFEGPAAAPAEGPPAALTYRFELIESPALEVRIHLAMQGGRGHETTFEVSREWGGVTTGGDDITDFAAHGATGRTLAVEHREPHRWRVQHAPGESLVVSYAFLPNTHQDESSPSVHRRPILNQHLFHAYGELALVCPGNLDVTLRRRIAFRWDGFETRGWKTACSFAVGGAPHAVEASLVEWREAIFMAGDFELLRRDVESYPVYTAIAGHDWTFRPEEFADLVQRVVALERGFFHDFDYPYYLVTAIPVGKPDPRSRSQGGTGLTNSFSVAMLPSSPLEGDASRAGDVRWLLAHEMFHNWCGHKIVLADPEQLVYWFSEGFTDFYARRLLFRGGLINRDDYVRGLNAKLADFFSSPVNTAPNERIRLDFWKSAAVKRLPYLRGDVVAMLADGAIRRASNGNHSLDDLMQALVREAGAEQVRVDTRTILRRIGDSAGVKTAEELRRVVEGGLLPEIDPGTFEPCLELRTVPLGVYELGFDFERSRSARRVSGVVPGSRAEAAGLRNGQELAAWSVQMGDPTKPVSVKIVEAGEERELGWLPVGDERLTPQFFVRAGAGAAQCAGL